MVPDDFTGYFGAAATAAGALIGLLFVAVSLRPESVFGKQAVATARAISGSAFTALVNSFFVSLIALIPGTNLGFTAAVMALISLYSTARLHFGLPGLGSARLQLVLALTAYSLQLCTGVLLTFHAHSRTLVYYLAYLLVASFAVALRRAWLLLSGEQAAEPDIQEA